MHPTRRHAFVVAGALSLLACSERSSPLRVAVVAIEPAGVTLLVGPAGGQTSQLSAAAFDSKGGEMLGQSVTWSTPTPSIVSVSTSGLVQAVAAGTGRVKAVAGGKADSITVTVLNVPVAALSIPLDEVALEVGPLGAGTQQLSALVQDSLGSTLTGRYVAWTSAAPAVATVLPNGLVTAVGEGTAYVRATSEGFSDSALVTVTAVTGLPAGIDLEISDAQWTQGSQSAEGTIPILRGGRAAVVNVTTTVNAAVVVPVQVVLRLFDSGGNLYRADTAAVVFPAGQTAFDAPTAQFLVPAADLLTGLRWEVERDPRGDLPDASASNDRWPREGDVPLALITPPLLRLRFVPVSLSSHGGVTGNVTSGNVESYLRLVRTFIPHGGIEATVGSVFSTTASYGTAPQGGGAAFWQSLIQQLDAARVASGADADAHWIGVVAPPSGFNFAFYGGWGYIPANGASYGPATRTFAVVNVGWFNYEPASRELTAHELGHNLGRAHAPCGNPSGPDPAYPESGGVVGAGGHDTYAWELGLASSAASIPTGTGDTMGYCSPVWASAYTYGGMLAFRGSAGVAVRSAAPPQRVLLVQGHVDDGRPRIDAQQLVTAPGSAGSALGAWVLEGHDRDGAVLFSHRFELGRYGETDAVRPFAVTVPVDAGTERTLASLHVSGLGASAVLRMP